MLNHLSTCFWYVHQQCTEISQTELKMQKHDPVENDHYYPN